MIWTSLKENRAGEPTPFFLNGYKADRRCMALETVQRRVVSTSFRNNFQFQLIDNLLARKKEILLLN